MLYLGSQFKFSFSCFSYILILSTNWIEMFNLGVGFMQFVETIGYIDAVCP